MNSFACTLEEFKRAVAKFLKHLENPDLSIDAIEQAHKLVSIYYLNMVGDAADILIAASYLMFANSRLLDRQTKETYSTIS